jgi:putative membrane protein
MWGCSNLIPFFGGRFSLSSTLLWVLVIAGIFLAVRAMRPSKGHRRGATADRNDAMRILRTRLAEGVISEEEFERLRRAVDS